MADGAAPVMPYAMPGTTSRILHLTDLHFGKEHAFAKDDGPLSRTLLRAIENDVKGKDAPDLLVVSGDIASTGSADEFIEAGIFLDALCSMLRLDRNQVLLVPGNHDALWGRGDGVSRAEYFSFVARFKKAYLTDIERPQLLQGKGVVVLGLDSTRVASASAGGIGLVGLDQLRDAEQVLSAVTEPAKRILVIHHHLLPVSWVEDEPPGMAVSHTVDARSILAWAQRNNFGCVLHGHQHQGMCATYHLTDEPGHPMLVCAGPSAGARNLPPQGRNGYQWVEVDGRNLHITRVVADESSSFKSLPRDEFVWDQAGVFLARNVPTARGSREPSSNEIRSLFRNAAVRVRDAVSGSYGPKGGLRSLGNADAPVHVRDGLQIAKYLSGSDPIESRLYSVVSALMSEVSRQLGDGRKTAALICATVVIESIESLNNGLSEARVARGVRDAAEAAAAGIAARARALTNFEDVRRVASAAAAGREDIGRAIVDAMQRVGKDGRVEIEAGRTAAAVSFTVEVLEPEYEVGGPPAWVAEQMVNGVLELTGPRVAVFEGAITSMRELTPLLELVASIGGPLLIMAYRVDEEPMAFAAVNFKGGSVAAVPLVVQKYTSQHVMRDIAAICGARVLRSESGDTIAAIVEADLGRIECARIRQGHVHLRPQSGPEATARVRDYVRALHVQHASAQSPYDQSVIQGRIARVLGAQARIVVTAASEAESSLLRGLVGDAFAASVMGGMAGVVDGGALALHDVGRDLVGTAPKGDEGAGWSAVAKALERVRQLLPNSGDAEPLDAAATLIGVVRMAAEAAARLIVTRTMEVGASPAQEKTVDEANGS